jgi:branched-chain amino acid transport system substrate-binding protein
MRLIVVAVAALTLAAGCGSGGSSSVGNGGSSSATPPSSSASTPSGTPIKIGNVGTYSGFAGTTSIGSKYGMEAWASYVNAHGGINGHPVDLIVKDDQGSATNALAAAKELVSQDHVIAIVGQHESGLESSWASYVSAQHIPVIGGPASGADWLTNPDFFPTSTTALNTLTLTMYTTLLAGQKKYGIIYCAEVPGCAQASTISKGIAGPLKVTYSGAVAISASAPNYTAQCVTLKNAGAQIVFTATAIDTARRFIADCAQQGYKPLFIDNPQNWSAAETKGSVWQGSWLAADSASWLMDNNVMSAYKAAMATYQPSAEIANTSATASWVAGEVLGAALAKSGVTGTPTSADVLKGLYALGPDFDLNGSIPPVTYTAGKPAVQKTCGWFMKITGGQVTAPKGTGQICVGS